MQPARKGFVPAMNKSSADLAGEHQRLLGLVSKAGDKDAFRELFVHFAPRIKALMIRSGAAHALAEDLVQDVMMSVWRKSALYHPGRGSVATWIYAIARNARTDRLRHKSSQPYVDVETLEIASDAPDGEREAAASQERADIAVAISALPSEQRQIIELAFAEDCSQSQISERLEIPLGTVKSRMRLAYAKLRENLGDHR